MGVPKAKWPKRQNSRPMPSSPSLSDRILPVTSPFSNIASPRMLMSPSQADVCAECASLRTALATMESKYKADYTALRASLHAVTQDLTRQAENNEKAISSLAIQVSETQSETIADLTTKYRLVGEAVLRAAKNTDKLRDEFIKMEERLTSLQQSLTLHAVHNLD